jgi:hypothetical protein
MKEKEKSKNELGVDDKNYEDNLIIGKKPTTARPLSAST